MDDENIHAHSREFMAFLHNKTPESIFVDDQERVIRPTVWAAEHLKDESDIWDFVEWLFEHGYDFCKIHNHSWLNEVDDKTEWLSEEHDFMWDYTKDVIKDLQVDHIWERILDLTAPRVREEDTLAKLIVRDWRKNPQTRLNKILYYAKKCGIEKTYVLLSQYEVEMAIGMLNVSD